MMLRLFHIIAIAVLCFATFAETIAHSATPVDVGGFLGIPWGATRDQVTQAVLKRDGVKIDKELTDEITFVGGRFAEMKVVTYQFLFFDQRLCKATVWLETDETRLLAEYQTVRKLLIEKYGKPTHNYAAFSRPYEAGDGHEARAIRSGKGDFSDFWFFPSEKTPKSSLWSTITTGLLIKLEYEDNPIARKFYERIKEKKKSDL